MAPGDALGVEAVGGAGGALPEQAHAIEHTNGMTKRLNMSCIIARDVASVAARSVIVARDRDLAFRVPWGDLGNDDFAAEARIVHRPGSSPFPPSLPHDLSSSPSDTV